MLKRLGSLALALVLVTLPLQSALAQETPPIQAEGISRLAGKIFGEDGKALAGAKVVAYHLSSEQSYESEPTDSKGQYSIQDLPYGYFDLAIITAEGWFVGTQVVNLAPAATGSISFNLAASDGQPGRSFPGTTEEAAGIATMKEKLKGRAFWTSPKGIAIIAASSAAAVLVLVAGGSSSSGGPPATESTP